MRWQPQPRATGKGRQAPRLGAESKGPRPATASGGCSHLRQHLGSSAGALVGEKGWGLWWVGAPCVHTWSVPGGTAVARGSPRTPDPAGTPQSKAEELGGGQGRGPVKSTRAPGPLRGTGLQVEDRGGSGGSASGDRAGRDTAHAQSGKQGDPRVLVRAGTSQGMRCRVVRTPPHTPAAGWGPRGLPGPGRALPSAELCSVCSPQPPARSRGT